MNVPLQLWILLKIVNNNNNERCFLWRSQSRQSNNSVLYKDKYHRTTWKHFCLVWSDRILILHNLTDHISLNSPRAEGWKCLKTRVSVMIPIIRSYLWKWMERETERQDELLIFYAGPRFLVSFTNPLMKVPSSSWTVAPSHFTALRHQLPLQHFQSPSWFPTLSVLFASSRFYAECGDED